MKKSYKGALAASAAGVILLGGAGSLAYWNATGDVPGGSITSGELKLDNAQCGGFVLDSVGGPGGAFDPSSGRIVPGDTLTKTCTFDITATGDHLLADLAVTQPTVSGDDTLSDVLTASGTFTVDNAAATQISSANNGDVLEAVVTIDFPYGASVDNLSQADTATLSDFTVTATQVDNH